MRKLFTGSIFTLLLLLSNHSFAQLSVYESLESAILDFNSEYELDFQEDEETGFWYLLEDGNLIALYYAQL